MLKDKNLLRVLLLLSLAFYLSGMKVFRLTGKEAPQEDAPLQTESGVGGLIHEESRDEADPELTGIPLPEEYSRPHMLTYSTYTLEKGDIIGNIAKTTGLNEDTLISVNNVKNARLLQIGQVIKIPNQDGIFYTAKAGDTLESIAEKYKTIAEHISIVNELFSDAIAPNDVLFIPGARMDWVNRQEIYGDLFIWPCSGYISSNYGYRMAPFAGTRQFHSGIDIASAMGAPVKAAMAGRVTQVGYDDSFGNFALISHHSGYRTFYGHMSVVRVKAGVFVGTGERIGDIGSTGLSTGPHLHFTVYKNGVTVNPRSLMK